MADPTPAIAKLEEAARDCLAAWPDLAGWAVLTETTTDVALAEEDGDAITIYTVGWQPDDDLMQGQTRHVVTLAFETASRGSATASIDRASQVAFARMVAAFHASDNLAGMVEDIQSIDVGTVQNGKDVGGASLHIRFTFYTPLGDWFTIVGATQTF